MKLSKLKNPKKNFTFQQTGRAGYRAETTRLGAQQGLADQRYGTSSQSACPWNSTGAFSRVSSGLQMFDIDKSMFFQVHSQLPLQQKRRYASQMPSSMKRVVCIPLINNNALFAVDKCHVGPKGYGNEAKLCLGRPNSSSWAASESPRQKFALVNSSLMTMSHRAAAVDRQHSHRSRHQLLCASIPSLLASSPPAIAANNRRASYYTGDTFNLGPSLGKGSNNCAVDNPTMVSDLDFLGHSGNNYLYRCDFAKHVVGFVVGKEHMFKRINPPFSAIWERAVHNAGEDLFAGESRLQDHWSIRRIFMYIQKLFFPTHRTHSWSAWKFTSSVGGGDRLQNSHSRQRFGEGQWI